MAAISAMVENVPDRSPNGSNAATMRDDKRLRSRRIAGPMLSRSNPKLLASIAWGGLDVRGRPVLLSCVAKPLGTTRQKLAENAIVGFHNDLDLHVAGGSDVHMDKSNPAT
ncbi:hypothetical protein FHS91_003362 [Sphingobium xanthum]|uniref:hypothetical protein n=1 Tax=Sphingobium xanthum TaxID=1387165 RepID=UPI001C8BD9AC|nr:hypothetical protein [Sphingobium xanthum]